MGEIARARYRYVAALQGDLSFEPGDIIQILEKHDTGWWVGQLENGTKGEFPYNFVEVISEDEVRINWEVKENESRQGKPAKKPPPTARKGQPKQPRMRPRSLRKKPPKESPAWLESRNQRPKKTPSSGAPAKKEPQKETPSWFEVQNARKKPQKTSPSWVRPQPIKKAPSSVEPAKKPAKRVPPRPYPQVRRKTRKNSKLTRAREALQQATAAGDLAPWDRGKLMIVGQGRAGKTSTVRRLLWQGFNANEASTLGVQTEQQFSVDLSQTTNGFVELNEKEDFVRRQIEKLARLRYKNGGKVSHVEGHAPELKTPTFQREIVQEEGIDNLTPVQGEGVKSGKLVEEDKKEETKVETQLASQDEEEDVARRYSESILGTIMDGEEETKVQLTIWDYGGQRVFYALHHLFLTEYGVYTVAFDMREVLNKEDAAVEYLQFWLRSTTLHAPNAPVLLVGTYRDVVGDKAEWKHIDKVLRDRVKVVSAYINQLVPNKNEGLAFFPIDNRYDVGLADVREAILISLKGKDFMEYPVPLSWISCLDYLLRSETSSKGYLTLSEVEAFARKHRIKQVSEVRLMLSFFHEIGSLFYFHRSKNLRNIVILDTQWLVNALTCLVFDNDIHARPIYDFRKSLAGDEELFLNTGILSQRLRMAKWKASEYSPDIQQKLLSLMDDMLLIRKWPWHESPGAFLVPSILLSERSLKAREEEEAVEEVGKLQGPSCEIDFGSSFLPDGLFQRLVCLCATFSEIFSEESLDAPIVRGRAALIDFGEDVTFGMQYIVAENKILVVVHKRSQTQVPRLSLSST